VIKVSGIPTREREYLIEEAIRLIQANPETAMKTEYLGIKNYASFGDQREDHTYGMGPRHGTIVFSIGRCGEAPVLPEDIDELIRVRDFGGKLIPEAVRHILLRYRDARKGVCWNYQTAIKTRDELRLALSEVESQLT